MAEGAIGDLVSVEGRRIIPWNADERRDWHKLRATGGGMWLVQGVHVIDQMSWLCGRPITAAIGIAATRFHPGQDADDFGAALVEMGDVTGTIRISGTRADVAPQVFTELHGTSGIIRVSHRGSLTLDTGGGETDLTDTVVNHWHATLDGDIAAFARLERHASPPSSAQYAGFGATMAEFAAVRRVQSATLADLMRAQDLVDAIYAAATTGR
ncbi:Gfo/Idh/MocA family protein [Devosia enhydra]|uniref:Gfo/Idh/MocA family protein n=1 Tax=Devosia enhydra TaxID=665118 RepID=UPI000930958B|nr:Gfo/Idh/MocA family oxidoreductase [Devosia enhydra]